MALNQRSVLLWIVVGSLLLAGCGGAASGPAEPAADGTLWSDVRSDWPHEPIRRFIPGTDSGTFDYFVEVVFDENEGPILAAENTQLSEDDNVLVTGVMGSPYAIGFFGFAFYQENEGDLRAVAIEGLEPSAQTVDAGEYPLARPLYIYSDAQIMRQKPQVAAFINFYLSHVNEEVVDVGYFPARDEALEQARQNWLQALGMGDEGATLPEVNPLEVSGDIVTGGSSTVFPLTERMAARFRDEGYSGNITVDSIGTGAGFERFCVAAETDIANASRPIRESEVETCRENGREPIEFRVGTDALAVTVSSENNFVDNVTIEELALIFGAGE